LVFHVWRATANMAAIAHETPVVWVPGQVERVPGRAEHACPVVLGPAGNHVREDTAGQGVGYVWLNLVVSVLLLCRQPQEHKITQPGQRQFCLVGLLPEGLQPAQMRCV
jgi:hypothetical protein